VQGFDDTYTAYADHQRRMEYFWCLRWLKQENRRHVPASVIKDDLVRLEEIPLILHVPGLGVHARGTRVMLEVVSTDELTVEASCRLLHVIDAPSASAPVEEEEAEEEIIETTDLSAESEAEAQAEAPQPAPPDDAQQSTEPTGS
jgi:exoribonuclease-2